MRNFTRKQKKMLRTMSITLSSCVLLATVLSVAVILNTPTAVPVRFSDIHEGAFVSYQEQDQDEQSPAQTIDPGYLYETLFPTQLLTFATSAAPVTTAPDDHMGAGGTLLLDTTATSPDVTEPPPTETSSAAETTTSAITTGSTTTARTTSATTAFTAATSAYTTRATTAAATTAAHTTKKPFTNIGGGVISNDADVYLRLLKLVNDARKENGLPELWYSARVHEAAAKRAYELSSYYSHERPNKTGFQTVYNELGIKYKFVGENIAYGRNMFETPEEVFQAWMDSKTHRDNILSPKFECVAFGLSTLKVGNDTYYYWSQEFAKFKA